MKKMFLAIVLLLAASVNAENLYGQGVSLQRTNVITRSQGLVSAAALPSHEVSSDCGCGLFSCGCGCY
jgi:hypothetical protein